MSFSQTYLVIGSGSIARRHIGNIKKLFGHARVGCISSSGRMLTPDEIGADTIVYQSIEQALKDRPILAIVASPAPFHVSQAASLLRAGVPVLVEKPLSDSLATFAVDGDVLRANRDRLEVAYNLRYLPSAIQLKSLLMDGALGNIHNVAIDVGQYLPDWRPASDYRKNVSARKELGGGVLLELSHELDYLIWLFGNFDAAYCIASNSGTLEIDVEDKVDAILSNKSGLVVGLHMDFLQRTPTRTCKIVGQSGTLIWNILRNSISLYDESGMEKVIFSNPEYDRNKMYLDEIERFSRVAVGELLPVVDVEHALSVLCLIEALKQSSATRQVVKVGDYSL